MKDDKEFYTIIPCTNNVKFVQAVGYDTEENKVIIEFIPVIAWKIYYEKNSNNDSYDFAQPIIAQAIENFSEGAIYYPDTEFWYSPVNFSGNGKENLINVIEEEYLKRNKIS